ncbi:MAG: division/cell wall cluster transcriptional repressor MraZ [Anaerolineae bacterium]
MEASAQSNNAVFSGEYEHGVDDKGRTTLPAKLRDSLGEVVFLARGLDGCLFLHSEEKWQVLTKKVGGSSLTNRMARALARMVFSASRCEVDKAGRILIPQGLRKFAGITNQVVIVGVENRVELWAPDRWERAMSLLSKTDESGVAEEWKALGI